MMVYGLLLNEKNKERGYDKDACSNKIHGA